MDKAMGIIAYWGLNQQGYNSDHLLNFLLTTSKYMHQVERTPRPYDVGGQNPS